MAFENGNIVLQQIEDWYTEFNDDEIIEEGAADDLENVWQPGDEGEILFPDPDAWDMVVEEAENLANQFGPVSYRS